MKNKKFYIAGAVMLVLAAAFTVFALTHPEASAPFPNTVTYVLYGVYLAAAVLVFLIPKIRRH